MLYAERAAVVAITREEKGVTVRVSIAGDGQPYYFGVEGKGEDAQRWLSELSIGDLVPVRGLPFARFNKELRRYEMWLTVMDAPQFGLDGAVTDGAQV